MDIKEYSDLEYVRFRGKESEKIELDLQPDGNYNLSCSKKVEEFPSLNPLIEFLREEDISIDSVVYLDKEAALEEKTVCLNLKSIQTYWIFKEEKRLVCEIGAGMFGPAEFNEPLLKHYGESRYATT